MKSLKKAPDQMVTRWLRRGFATRGECCFFERPKPLRAPGRLLQGSFSLEVSLALVGVIVLPGLIPIIEYPETECNRKMDIIFGRLRAGVFPDPQALVLSLYFHSGQAFQDLNGGADVFFPVTGRNRRLEHLASQGGQRCRYIQFRCRLQHQPNILVHPLHREVGRKVATEDKRGLVLDQARLRCRIRKDVQHQGGRYPSLCTQHDTFVERL